MKNYTGLGGDVLVRSVFIAEFIEMLSAGGNGA